MDFLNVVIFMVRLIYYGEIKKGIYLISPIVIKVKNEDYKKFK